MQFLQVTHKWFCNTVKPWVLMCVCTQYGGYGGEGGALSQKIV
jgi:hypothetical protein